MDKIDELYTDTDDRIGEIAEKLNEVIRVINVLIAHESNEGS